MFFAFYAAKWDGEIELRGLKNKTYKVFDYVNDKFISNVDGNNPKIKVKFDKYLLIKAIPDK